MNPKSLLKEIKKTSDLIRKNTSQINKYLKSNKIPFEDRLIFFKQIPEEHKNKYNSILREDKFYYSHLFRDIMLEHLDFRKGEKIGFERYFLFHESDIEAKIENFGYDANITEEQFTNLFPKEQFWEDAYSFETYHVFLKAREEWVKFNIGYFIHTW